MNVRKTIDYTAMFAALDALMAADLPQMELYFEIGKLVSGRPEKGAAVAAAEYLCSAYPDASGFSHGTSPDAGILPCLCQHAGDTGRGHGHRLDAERGYSGGGADVPGSGVVHPGSTAIWMVKAGAAKKNQGRRAHGNRSRLHKRSVLY